MLNTEFLHRAPAGRAGATLRAIPGVSVTDGVRLRCVEVAVTAIGADGKGRAVSLAQMPHFVGMVQSAPIEYAEAIRRALSGPTAPYPPAF